MYPSHQIIWDDSTGRQVFVSSQPNSFVAAMTIALALQNTQSAKHIEIHECGNTETGGIYFKERLNWTKQS